MFFLMHVILTIRYFILTCSVFFIVNVLLCSVYVELKRKTSTAYYILELVYGYH